jgi:hypothetical protein
MAHKQSALQLPTARTQPPRVIGTRHKVCGGFFKAANGDDYRIGIRPKGIVEAETGVLAAEEEAGLKMRSLQPMNRRNARSQCDSISLNVDVREVRQHIRTPQHFDDDIGKLLPLPLQNLSG